MPRDEHMPKNDSVWSRFSAAVVGTFGEAWGAVSYTHLDVYKRQRKHAEWFVDHAVPQGWAGGTE